MQVIVGLQPVQAGSTLWGPAFTVRGHAGDNLALHRALAGAQKGDVIVAQLTGLAQAGHWGELMSIAAAVAGLAGLIIDAAIRDAASIEARGFPVFFRGTHPSPAAKEYAGELQTPITLRGVAVTPGDGMFADDDGIIVVPRRYLAVSVEAAARVDRREQAIAVRLEAGESTVQVLGLDVLTPQERGEPEDRH